MKKTFSLFLILFFTLSASAQAEEVFNFTSFYPTPAGNYQTIRLKPQSALPTSNCNLGTMYANADDNNLPYYCGPTVGLPAFAPIAGPWTLNSDDLYLTDSSTPENKKIGIGTITPIFKLTLENDGGILSDGLASSSSALDVAGIAGAGAKLIWYPLKGAFRAGYVDSNQWDDANIGTSSMAMGFGNTASSKGASVWGGQNNSATAEASPFAPVIAGGKNNTTTGELSQIIGGSDNIDIGTSNLISGELSKVYGNYSTVGGGQYNYLKGDYLIISGGAENWAAPLGIGSISKSTISGGKWNNTSGNYTTNSGGYSNSINSGAGPSVNYSTISGGFNNFINGGSYAVVSGGNHNNYSFVIGGDYSTVSGGYNNVAPRAYSMITGGSDNYCSYNAYTSILGGDHNIAVGTYSTILGGRSNITNTNSGDHAIVPGGQNNIADGAYSLAAGRNMNVSGNHSFVWGYSASAIGAITASDAMIIYSGSMGIRDTTPAALLEINGNGSVDNYLNLSTTAGSIGDIFTIKNNGFVGVKQSNPAYPLQFGNGAYVDHAGFFNASSRDYKENILELKTSDALSAFANLQPMQYNYKNEPDHRYIGFIAEDVPDLVASQGRQGLSPMDMAALLTKVIAHQQDVLKDQKDETDKLLKEFEELKNKVQIKNQSKARLKSL